MQGEESKRANLLSKMFESLFQGLVDDIEAIAIWIALVEEELDVEIE